MEKNHTSISFCSYEHIHASQLRVSSKLAPKLASYNEMFVLQMAPLIFNHCPLDEGGSFGNMCLRKENFASSQQLLKIRNFEIST